LLKGAEEELSPEEKARRERMRVTSRGFTDFQLTKDGSRILLSLSGKLYLFQRSSGQVQEIKTSPGQSSIQSSLPTTSIFLTSLIMTSTHTI
jgi:dipeptidyl-peptidase-4